MIIPSRGFPRTPLCFPFFFELLSISGAGSVGLPEPRWDFNFSSAAFATDCDCWITLNSFTSNFDCRFQLIETLSFAYSNKGMTD